MQPNSGVYKITNLVNNKIYIGSSKSLRGRKATHFSSLLKNKHHSIYLQRAFNKYGINNFNFDIIIFCSIDNLLFYEQRLIDGLKPSYNIYQVAGSPIGTKRTKKIKKKMSDIWTINRRKDWSERMKVMRGEKELKIHGNKMKEWWSLRTKEQREEYAKKMSISKKGWQKNFTKEEMIEYKDKVSKGLKKFYLDPNNKDQVEKIIYFARNAINIHKERQKCYQHTQSI